MTYACEDVALPLQPSSTWPSFGALEVEIGGKQKLGARQRLNTNLILGPRELKLWQIWACLDLRKVTLSLRLVYFSNTY